MTETETAPNLKNECTAELKPTKEKEDDPLSKVRTQTMKTPG